jgi:hypothetical protein
MSDQSVTIDHTVFTSNTTAFAGKSSEWTAVFLAAIAGGQSIDSAWCAADNVIERLRKEAASTSAPQVKLTRGDWTWTILHTRDSGPRLRLVAEVDAHRAMLQGSGAVMLDLCSAPIDIVSLIRETLHLDPRAAVTLTWDHPPFEIAEPRIIEVKVESWPVTCNEWSQLVDARLPMGKDPSA